MNPDGVSQRDSQDSCSPLNIGTRREFLVSTSGSLSVLAGVRLPEFSAVFSAAPLPEVIAKVRALTTELVTLPSWALVRSTSLDGGPTSDRLKSLYDVYTDPEHSLARYWYSELYNLVRVEKNGDLPEIAKRVAELRPVAEPFLLRHHASLLQYIRDLMGREREAHCHYSSDALRLDLAAAGIDNHGVQEYLGSVQRMLRNGAVDEFNPQHIVDTFEGKKPLLLRGLGYLRQQLGDDVMDQVRATIEQGRTAPDVVEVRRLESQYRAQVLKGEYVFIEHPFIARFRAYATDLLQHEEFEPHRTPRSFVTALDTVF